MNKSVKIANSILSAGIVLFALILLYAFIKSGSNPHGSMYPYYLTCSAFIALLIIVLLKCKDETKANVALLFIITGIGIYTIELLLIAYSFHKDTTDIPAEASPEITAHAKNNKPPVDSRNKFQITMDLRKDGVNAYPHVMTFYSLLAEGLTYKENKIFPLGAISNKTTVFCNEHSEPIIFEADEHGFRNPKGQYVPGIPDIALIGDSFAQGYCVREGDDIAGQLRKNNLKTMNLGMAGSGPLIQLGIFSEFAKPFQPKHVFWLYWEGNDAINLTSEKNIPILMKYLDRNFFQNLVQQQESADNTLINYIEKKILMKTNPAKKIIAPETEERDSSTQKFYTQIIKAVKLTNLRLKLGLHKYCVCEPDSLFENILLRARNSVDEWGGQLHIVYLPSAERYENNLCRRRLFHTRRKKMLSLAKRLNINVADMTPSFNSHKEPLSLFDGHYNSKGYALVSREIEAHLTNSLN